MFWHLSNFACSVFHAHNHHIGPFRRVLRRVEKGMRKESRCRVLIPSCSPLQIVRAGQARPKGVTLVDSEPTPDQTSCPIS